ncbi:MAG: hypothetical protein L0220_06110 [Acidobacteria bacterium]|nr:hypothetical protein [Acidobacteriota bacterium]
MNDAGVRIKDYLGNFAAHHVDLSEGRVALKVSTREVEILGEALVKEVVGWAMDPNSRPLPEYGNYECDFLADISTQQLDNSKDDVLVRFTSSDIQVLGQFFVLGMLRWVQSIQVARRRTDRLRDAILAKQTEMEAELENHEGDRNGNLIN